jgi:hypothetical protein
MRIAFSVSAVPLICPPTAAIGSDWPWDRWERWPRSNHCCTSDHWHARTWPLSMPTRRWRTACADPNLAGVGKW